MKKRTMALAMAASFLGICGSPALGQNVEKKGTEPGKILVAYYSYSGNTRYAAEQIRKATGGDLFEIKPVKAYPSDYNTCVSQAKKEISAGFKPELAERVKDIRRRTRVVGSFPDGYSAMMLVGARLRHISTTKWGTRQYMNTYKLYEGGVM